MSAAQQTYDEALRALVDDYRTRCLWFLRQDYFPQTPAQQRRVLGSIRKHGDQAAHVRASHLGQWLSQRSNASSVTS